MDELVTVDVSAKLVMAMVGWVRAGMEVMGGMHAGQSLGELVADQIARLPGSQLWVGSSRNWFL